MLFLDNGHSVTGIDRMQSSIEHDNYTHIVNDVRDIDSLPEINDIDILINNAGTQNEDDIEITTENGDTIDFTAYIEFPATVVSIVEQLCTLCLVPFNQNISNLPNAQITFTSAPVLQQGYTFRNMLQWCAGLMGTNAWIDWDGNLRFSWYDSATGYTLTRQNRFSSDLFENNVVVTGVKYVSNDEEKTVYVAGNETYAIDVSCNALVTDVNITSVLANLYAALHDFTYRPFTASVVCAPYLWPMDKVTFTDKNGTSCLSILTNTNYTLNGVTELAGNGQSLQAASGALPGCFTPQQAGVLENIRNVTGDAIEKAVENATALITGADNGYVRFIYDNDVLTEIVVMDTDDIETATKVWRWNQGGLGYSRNGYNGPYTLAMTQNGAIVADFITTGHLNVARISGSISNSGWGIDFTNGTFTIGNISANNITSGTLSASRIAANSISVSKLTGSISNSGWNIDLTNGTFTIGNISANNITSGTLSADKIYGGAVTVGGWNNQNGEIVVRDSDSDVVCYIDNDGIEIFSTIYDPDFGYGTIQLQNGKMKFSGTRLSGGLNFYPGWSSVDNQFALYVDGTAICFDCYTYVRNSHEFVAEGESWLLGPTYVGKMEIYTYLNVDGDLTVSGTKSRIVNTEQYSNRLLYCYESPSPLFGDVGEGVIGEDGRCYVWIDPIFAQTITTEQYQVFLQKYGRGECVVSERNLAYFVVNGEPGLAFGWEIKAKQSGFDQKRLEVFDNTFKIQKHTYGEDAVEHITAIMKERSDAA